jgi:23S rRNA (cytosine1962-C5)-methyltransferase
MIEDRMILKPGRERSVLNRHPWIFASAVDRLEGQHQDGGNILVCNSQHQPLGWASLSYNSQIRARLWTFNPDQLITRDLIEQRLQRAFHLRSTLVPAAETNALRLVHAESDGLPGVVVDRYGEILVMQCLTAGADYWRETIKEILINLYQPESLYERSDVDIRTLEHLPSRTGLLYGRPLDELIQINENQLSFWVDIAQGHKTGFYLDQRSNRAVVRDLSQGKKVLNCFSYSGSFTVNALHGGASSVLSIDTSQAALELAQKNVTLNNLPLDQCDWSEEDVFKALRRLRDQAESFDLIILDPPKFAPTSAQVERAARGYKDINLLAFKLLRTNGILVTFSCSGGITPDLFQKIVFSAALDAGVSARWVKSLTQGCDHPVDLCFPEGAYLKGLVCMV